MRFVIVISLTLATLLFAVPQSAEAYVGPGAGLTAIGTSVALIGAVLLAIVGFVWYPIKRLRAKYSSIKKKADEETATS
jgi:type VI protein secretion system component VasK